MFRKSVVFTIALACSGFAAVASAQTSAPSFSNSPEGRGIVGNAFTRVSFADDQPSAAATARSAALPASSGPELFGRVQVGLVNAGGSTGLVLGGGVTAQPFTNKSVEVLVDANFSRINAYNGLYISANVVYDFVLKDEKVTPYAGAGLGIVHFSGDTQTKFQILGGVKAPLQNKRDVFGELRILFTDGDTATFIIGGLRF